ncbi:toll/interleukin-1 receptor domain-containing protein [Desulfogranum marinum]|uniref:toll/interleukin-1 receptor domain-containing protein n=1 Tax=Desulfogranum marinum TaxID=453220 RepID=UPI0029C73F0D|nr:toll/interleukin-1 receptor domain-containing protein [Desulfogranum marinum]
MQVKRVFLSHSSKDKPFVRELDKALRAFGVDTFLDERDIGIGEDIPQKVYDALQEATYVCYILSNNSVDSEWVKEELSVAKMLEKERGGVFILPILIENIKIPTAIKSKRYADFRTNSSLRIDSLPLRLLLSALDIKMGEIPKQLTPTMQHRILLLHQEFVSQGAVALQVLNELDGILSSLSKEYKEFEYWMDRSYYGTSDREELRRRKFDFSRGHIDGERAWADRDAYRGVFDKRINDAIQHLDYGDIIYKQETVRNTLTLMVQMPYPEAMTVHISEASELFHQLLMHLDQFSGIDSYDTFINENGLSIVYDLRSTIAKVRITTLDLIYQTSYYVTQMIDTNANK